MSKVKIRNRNDRQRWTIPEIRPMVIVFAFLVGFVVMSCSAGSDDFYPIIPDEQSIAEGKLIYETNCSSCHGGPGQSPPLSEAPRHTADGHTWHHADRALVEWVLDGVPLAQTMPAFRGTLTEEEVSATLSYIKSWWPEEVQVRQIKGSTDYEKQLKGESLVP